MRKTRPNSLFIANSLYGGGIEEFIFNIVENIKSVNPILYAPDEKHKDFDKKTSIKIERRNINSHSIKTRILYKLSYLVGAHYIFRSFQYKKHIKQLIQKHKIELINCCHFHLGPISYYVYRKYGIPYIIYTYGQEVVINNVCKNNPIVFWYMKRVLKNANVIISNCDFTSSLIAKWGINKAKIVKIPNGVDPNYFVPKSNISNDDLPFFLKGKDIILTVGRLIRRKGHDTVIKALKKIKNKNPNFSYVIVGEGPELKNLKELVRKLNLEDFVFFAGRVSDEELLNYYQNCVFFIMLSYEIGSKNDVEGMPLVYLQASSCAKPNVASFSGGIEEAVLDGETGYVIDPKDVYSCSEVMDKLLNEKELSKKLGENGRMYIEKHMNWILGVKKLDQIINNYF
tara:strand:+ start:5227 stop:6423 length:1197 start_codon:yes stop_codon:yes gene_type:complete